MTSAVLFAADVKGDVYGILYLFLSIFLSDVWSWNPSNDEWEWLQNGTDSYSNEYRMYNGNTIYSPTNFVGARAGSATWMKSDTQLVVYGGYGYGASLDPFPSPHVLNDYRVFNPNTSFDTWSGGDGNTLTTDSLKPVFGTLGVAAGSVYPGAR